MLPQAFFDRPADVVAEALVGKVIRRQFNGTWLAAAIVETEAYGGDKASHSYLGRTPSREAMWAKPGTIYMYHSRGGPSLNFSVAGGGCAVLVKSGRPWLDEMSGRDALGVMHRLNPGPRGLREDHRLLSGQTLLARALGLEVRGWNGKPLSKQGLYLEDTGYRPRALIKCCRLGIPAGRDEHLKLRFVDEEFARSATQNPLTRRSWAEGVDYERIVPRQ